MEHMKIWLLRFKGHRRMSSALLDVNLAPYSRPKASFIRPRPCLGCEGCDLGMEGRAIMRTSFDMCPRLEGAMAAEGRVFLAGAPLDF